MVHSDRKVPTKPHQQLITTVKPEYYNSPFMAILNNDSPGQWPVGSSDTVYEKLEENDAEQWEVRNILVNCQYIV